jgi:hypothetical protein
MCGSCRVQLPRALSSGRLLERGDHLLRSASTNHRRPDHDRRADDLNHPKPVQQQVQVDC